MKRLYAILILALFTVGSVWGQGQTPYFKHFIDYEIESGKKQSYLSLIIEQYPGVYLGCNRNAIYHFNDNGDVISTFANYYNGDTVEYDQAISNPADSTVVLFGKKSILQGNKEYNTCFVIKKIDKHGNIIWRSQIGVDNFTTNYSYYKIYKTFNGNYLISSLERDPLLPPNSSNQFVLKINSVGDSLWTSNAPLSGRGFLFQLPDSTIISGNVSLRYTIHLNANGDSINSYFNLWKIQYPAYYGNPFYDDTIISITPDTIYKHSPMGIIYQKETYYSPYPNKTFAAIEIHKAVNGGYIAIGNFIDTSYLYQQIGLGIVRFNDDLSTKYFRNYEFDSTSLQTEQYKIDQNLNGSLIIAGSRTRSGMIASTFILKLDSAGNLFNNVIEGTLYNDPNVNCVFDNLETPLNRWIVIAEGKYNHYSITDPSGHYYMNVDTGIYEMKFHPQSSYWDNNGCNPNTTVNFNTLNDTTAMVDNGFQSFANCPDMIVGLGTNNIRPCFSSSAYIAYCNHGTVAADSAFIDVTLDRNLSLLNASLPYDSITHDTYRFQLGKLIPGQCGQFWLNVFLDCNTLLGTTHCIEAHIYPDSICELHDPSWDESSLVLEADCENNDSVAFRIINQGQNMLSHTEYGIIQDDVMYARGSIQLISQQIFRQVLPANGSTWTMYVNQVNGHPGDDHPIVSIEGCGTDSMGNISMGYVQQFARNTNDYFKVRSCVVATGSFDPNDKTPTPLGVGVEGLIDDNQRVDYKIRFQNTGTDTAFTVVIRDTLTDLLEITSLKLGPATHTYSFEIELGRILTWTFNNILLPDSNVNEPGSHGFVTFSIEQQPDLAPGTVIENRAGIFFDFNEVVLTNTTKNTIVEDLMIALKVKETFSVDGINRLYPNPNSGQLIIDLSGLVLSNAQLTFYNITGQQVKKISLGDAQNIFTTEIDLNQGLYFYELINDKSALSRGKLIVE